MSDDEAPEVPGHRLEAVIGVGASAVVWAGTDAAGNPVAVKVPRVGGAPERPVAEQQVLLAVRHPHLVTLRSVVPIADGREALVFDRVDGVALSAMVDARGHLRAGEVVTVLTPLCDAVATLHRAGGLHADISAGNVTVTTDGRPVLLDLGAARVAGSADEQVWGTAGFVAPEVSAGEPPSDASDVYSLGALAWFCATGNGAPDTMLRLDRDVVSSHVGEELADAIGACIDPDPAQRPTSDALARLFYEAAPAHPVEVVVGTDLASALTHRLRAEARADAPEADSGSDRRRARWPSTAVLSSVLSSVRVVRVVRGAMAARVAPALRRPVAVLVGAAVVAVAAGGWAVASRAGAGAGRPLVTGPVGVSATAGTTPRPATTPGPGPTPTAAPGVTTRVPPAAESVPEPAALLRSPTAPADHAAALLQLLGDARTRALVARDVAALSAVHRTGGPSWIADRQVIESLRSAGARWEGLRLEVATATYVPAVEPTPGQAAAVGSSSAGVRARVDWTAYTVVTGAGARAARAAQEGELLDFHLVRGAQGWRIESISRAPAS